MGPEVFWDDFLDSLEHELESAPGTTELRSLLLQGRLWQSWMRHTQPRVESFAVTEWIERMESLGWGRIEAESTFSEPRQGDPWMLELLCRALLSNLGSASLRLEADPKALWLRSPQGWPPPTLKGPLLRRLSWSLSLEWHEDGVKVPFPVLPPTGSGAVDLEALRRTTLDDPEFERELIETFLAEGQRQLDSLGLRYATNVLHSFRGSAAMVGAYPLVEMLACEERLPEPGHLPQLKKEFEAVRQCLERRLSELTS